MVSDIVENKSPLLPTTDNILHGKTNHTSYKQQGGNKSCTSNTGRGINERTNAIFDSNAGLPFMTYLNPDCQSCIINTAIMSNKGCIGQYVLPKASASILLPIGNEQYDKEMRFKSGDGEINSNKTCHKHIELNVTANSNSKSIACNHAQLSSPLNSNGPETFQTKDILNCYCSKNEHSKLRKSLSKCERPASSDSRLGEPRKFEETSEKETIDRNKFKDMNIMCPSCFKKPCACKPCTCNFSSKEYNANPPASSDVLSNIWEYLRQQDQKIDLIHEKVSSFLSQHASCLTVKSSQGNEFSATESDIPYILNILEVHSDKIRELQDQIDLLKSSEHISSANDKIDGSVLNQAQTINYVNTETYNEDIHCPYSHIVYHKQRQKVTTSTSTMTSFTTEKNDKLVYHKQRTMVSSMGEKKDSLCLPNEHDSPTTKKHLDEENVKSNSQKRKSHKLNNCSPSLKLKKNVSSNSSSDAPDLDDNQVFKTSHKSEKKSKRVSTRNKVTNKSVEPEDQPYPTKLKNVLKNANDPVMKDNNVEEKKNSPTLKTAALKANSQPFKQRPRNSKSPNKIDTDTIKDLGNKKVIHQISASSSSTDTEYKSTKQKQKTFDKTELDSEDTDSDSEESTTVSKYGLSSKNLSKATKRYLDTYGLRRPGHLSNQYNM
ncbi:unnamed protein product [Larinioides sclopetarius]